MLQLNEIAPTGQKAIIPAKHFCSDYPLFLTSSFSHHGKIDYEKLRKIFRFRPFIFWDNSSETNDSLFIYPFFRNFTGSSILASCSLELNWFHSIMIFVLLTVHCKSETNDTNACGNINSLVDLSVNPAGSNMTRPRQWKSNVSGTHQRIHISYRRDIPQNTDSGTCSRCSNTRHHPYKHSSSRKCCSLQMLTSSCNRRWVTSNVATTMEQATIQYTIQH